MAQKPVAVVTGGSSGIGKETVKALHEKGCRVYELSRHGKDTGTARHIFLDVTDDRSVKDAVDRIIAEAGRIDILVNCAGMGIAGAIEFTGTEEAKLQFDTVFFGMDRMCRAVIPHMRARGGGHIVNVSSVAAVAPIPYQAYYAAAKAAVNSYTMALANEVRPFGIRCCAVQPGDIKTGFTAARRSNLEGDGIYEGRIQKGIGKMEKDEQNGMPPSAVAHVIASAAFKKAPRPVWTVGFMYKALCLLIKLLPAGVENFILRKMY